jgi:uncharacterized membrane protein
MNAFKMLVLFAISVIDIAAFIVGITLSANKQFYNIAFFCILIVIIFSLIIIVAISAEEKEEEKPEKNKQKIKVFE